MAAHPDKRTSSAQAHALLNVILADTAAMNLLGDFATQPDVDDNEVSDGTLATLSAFGHALLTHAE